MYASKLWRARFKSISGRLTGNRFLFGFLVLSAAQCATQLVFQSAALASDVETYDATDVLLEQSGFNLPGIPVIEHGQLLVCSMLPGAPGASCTVVSDMMKRDGTEARALANDEAALDSSTPGVQATLPLLTPRSHIVTVSKQCTRAMIWPNYIFGDAVREDAVTILFQVWLMTLAIMALLNESIPHLLAHLAGTLLSTVWAGYRVQHAVYLQDTFESYVVHGACSGINVLGAAIDGRLGAAIATLVFSVAGLAATAWLTMKLLKGFAHQTFGRVGASEEVNRVYKLVLALSVCLMLSCFFSLAGTALWLNKISTQPFSAVVTFRMLRQAGAGVTLVLQVPWMLLGIYCVRRECRRLFAAFFVLSLLVLADWSVMVASDLYRDMFSAWPFFATVTVAAFGLSVASTFLAVACRCRFGRGFAQFLQVQTILAKEDFTVERISIDPEEKLNDELDLEEKPRGLVEADTFSNVSSFIVAHAQPSRLQYAVGKTRLAGLLGCEPTLVRPNGVGAGPVKIDLAIVVDRERQLIAQSVYDDGMPATGLTHAASFTSSASRPSLPVPPPRAAVDPAPRPASLAFNTMATTSSPEPAAAPSVYAQANRSRTPPSPVPSAWRRVLDMSLRGMHTRRQSAYTETTSSSNNTFGVPSSPWRGTGSQDRERGADSSFLKL